MKIFFAIAAGLLIGESNLSSAFSQTLIPTDPEGKMDSPVRDQKPARSSSGKEFKIVLPDELGNHSGKATSNTILVGDEDKTQRIIIHSGKDELIGCKRMSAARITCPDGVYLKSAGLLDSFRNIKKNRSLPDSPQPGSQIMDQSAPAAK